MAVILWQTSNLTLRALAPLSRARASATDPEVVSRYFDLLEQTMSDLLEKPCQIFNIDESGIPLDPKQQKVVCKRGVKKKPLVLPQATRPRSLWLRASVPRAVACHQHATNGDPR